MTQQDGSPAYGTGDDAAAGGPDAGSAYPHAPYGQAPYAQPAHGQAPYAQPGHGEAPYAQTPYAQGAYGQGSYGQGSYGQGSYGQASYGQAAYDQAPYGRPAAPYAGPYGQPYGYAPVPQRTNGMAIASMVLGILWLYWIGSVLALVFGYIAKNQIRERGEAGGGMATAGIVLGWIGVGILVLATIFGIAATV